MSQISLALCDQYANIQQQTHSRHSPCVLRLCTDVHYDANIVIVSPETDECTRHLPPCYDFKSRTNKAAL